MRIEIIVEVGRVRERVVYDGPAAQLWELPIADELPALMAAVEARSVEKEGPDEAGSHTDSNS